MIYFLTKTFPPQDSGGGALLKQHTVKLLQKNNLDVQVICVGKQDHVSENSTFIRYRKNAKIELLKQRLGIIEDYLDTWSMEIISSLAKSLNKSDTVFATSGGELSGLKIGHHLKEITGCKYVAHFHDPLDHTTINKETVDYKYHVRRDKFLQLYLSNCDKIMTSTKSYARHLSLIIDCPVDYSYFGYIDSDYSIPEPNNFISTEKINIIYGGTDGYAQKSSQIFDLMKKSRLNKDDYKWHIFAKKYVNYKGFNITNHGLVSREEFIKTLRYPNMVGYVSLKPSYFRNCLPSKIYDLVLLKIPILAIVPYGEAFELIRDLGIGVSVVPGDYNGLELGLRKLNNGRSYDEFRANQEACQSNFDPVVYEKKLMQLLEFKNAT